jgi:uncharacterized RDD family membrane protein YckC
MSTFERTGYGSESAMPEKHQSDEHYIDTPEQVGVHYSVAGLGSRFVAVLLDQLIIGAVYLVLGVLFVVMMAAIGASKKFDTLTMWFVAVLVFVVFVVTWGYFALFEAYWHGQTPGKRVMQLRVIKDSGRQITLFEALARNLLRFVDYLPSAYLIGVITMLCNKRSKRVGDFVAGTIVVHERVEEQPMLFQSAANRSGLSIASTPAWVDHEPWRDEVPAMFPADAVAKLNGQDLVVIETFFGRMLDLPMETRAAMAYKISGQMATKMGVTLTEGNPERALESMAYQMRGSGRANF